VFVLFAVVIFVVILFVVVPGTVYRQCVLMFNYFGNYRSTLMWNISVIFRSIVFICFKVSDCCLNKPFSFSPSSAYHSRDPDSIFCILPVVQSFTAHVASLRNTCCPHVRI
jgi:hypothetical protein